MTNKVDIQTVKIDGAPMTFGEYYDNLEAYVKLHELIEIDEDYPLPSDYVRSMWMDELPIPVASYQIAKEGC